MTRSWTTLMMLAAASIMTIAVPATAAPRTVCFSLKFADGRYNCPAPGTGALRGCQSGSDVDAVGHEVELWRRRQQSRRPHRHLVHQRSRDAVRHLRVGGLGG